MTENNNIIPPLNFKVILLGSIGAGKSSILKQLVYDDFRKYYEATIGVDFGNTYQEIDGKQCKFSVWDTSGSKNFFNIVKSYFHNTDIGLLIFDLTDPHSFAECSYWYEQYRNINPNKPMLLIGNKCDKINDIQVSDDEISTFITNSCHIKYMQVSAATRENLESILEEIYKCTPVNRKNNIDLRKKKENNLCCTIL